MKVFVSYYSLEEADAEDVANHVKWAFAGEGVEVFMASNWESIQPGEEWEPKVLDELKVADALVVLMSLDALTRPFINFEIGVAWASKPRVLIFCHKGLTPDALPRPYGSLQTVNLNNLTHDLRLQKIAEAIGTGLGVTPRPTQEAATGNEAPAVVATTDAITFPTTNRTWGLRPAAHVGEKATGHFLVGAVNPARADRAKAAGLKPGEALHVRLFLGNSPEGRYINAMVGGENAAFFERVIRDTCVIEGEIRLAASFQDEGGNTIPVLVVDSYKELPSAAADSSSRSM